MAPGNRKARGAAPAPPHHRRGFTLPEIIFALFMMAFAVSVFAVSFPAAAQAISRSRHLDQAANSCQQQLEFYRDVGYSSLPAISAGSQSVSLSFTPTSDLPGATGTVTLTQVDSAFAATTAVTGRITIDVTVAWIGVGSDRGTHTVTSLIIQ